MPRVLQRLKNPSPKRTEQFYSACYAHYSGLVSLTATIKIITELNRQARKRKITTYLDPPPPPPIPNALYDKVIPSFHVIPNFGDPYIRSAEGKSKEDYVYDMYKLLKPYGEESTFRLLINYRGRRSEANDETQGKKLTNVDEEIKFYKNLPRFQVQFLVDRISERPFKFDTGDRVVIIPPTEITAERLFQHFAEGISNCVFVPIYNKFTNLMANAKSKETARKYIRYVRDLKLLEAEYKNGVPEDCMERVAKTAHMKICLYDIFKKEIATYNENGKTGVVTLQNTRFNHVDDGDLVMNGDAIKVSQERINEIWADCHKRNIFYDVLGSIKNDNIKRIKTLDCVYQLENKQNEILNEFSKSIKLENYKFNNHTYPAVRDFIKAGCIVNSAPVKINDGIATGHIDMSKAYTQFKKCSFYAGFMGVIHQCAKDSFTIDYITEHIGIYKIKIVECNDKLLNKLGIVTGSEHVLPSVEILYFVSEGVKVDITEGVWGSRFDFEFPDHMLLKDDGLSRYSKWSGKLAMEINETVHNIKCEEKMAKVLKCSYPQLDYWADKKIARIPIKNNASRTCTHILAFITSYVRIQMFQEMRKFDYDNILTVVLDGIYFKGAKPDTWFVEKEIKNVEYHQDSWYSIFNVPSIEGNLRIQRNTLLTGQGGCGKTHGILTAGNFNDILYVVPTHVLGRKVYEKYKCKYITIHKLIGVDCTPYIADHSIPPVILVDEITQYPADWIDQIFILYPNSLIIFAGDIISSGQWFQCRSGTPGKFAKIWKPVNVDIINIEGDRRAKDDKLKALKLTIRDKMKEIFIDGDTGECDYLKRWITSIVPTIGYGEAITQFQVGDVWLASTHRVNNALLTAGVVSGFYKEGGDTSPVAKDGFKKRGSYTIHSIQGATLENRRIFISVDDTFEYSMLYTAISRATHYDQLVFVK